MKKYFLMLAVAMTMAGAPLYAQMLGFSHSVSVIGVIPTGQFSKSVRIENAALPIFERSQIGSDAAFGIGFSYRIGKSFDVLVGDLQPFAEVGFMWNRIGSDNRDRFDDQRSKAPRYRNMPLMIGVQYRHDLLPLIKPYIELGFGVDWFLPVREGWSSDDTKPYYVFKSSSATAWQLGIGTYIGGMVSVGLSYYGLGKHAFDFNESSTEHPGQAGFGKIENNKSTEYRRINALMLKVAFHF